MNGTAGRFGETSTGPDVVGFDRKARGLTGIVIKGFLLSLVTFGIYRFWYITNLRRFFWSRTTIAGSPAEYIGRGKELFLGFLVALAILVPVYVVLFILGFVIPALAPYASVLTFVFLFLLGQYAIYRGRRYRASRTVWRGIRLAQDGSAMTYVAMATGWWLLTIVTAGLAFPYMRASLERYRINHTLVGESRMRSTASGNSILGPWLVFYALGVVPAVGLLAYWIAKQGYTLPPDLLIPDPSGDEEEIFNPAYLEGGLATMLWVYAGALTAIVPLLFLLIPYYRARETRAFMQAASLAGARLTSTLRARQFYWPYILYFLSVIALTTLLAIAFGIVLFVMAGLANLGDAGNGDPALEWLFGIGGVLIYLTAILVYAVLYVRVVTVRLWHAVCVTTSVDDVGALEAVLASARRPGSGLNEGLADALDVGGAIEIGF